MLLPLTLEETSLLSEVRPATCVWPHVLRPPGFSLPHQQLLLFLYFFFSLVTDFTPLDFKHRKSPSSRSEFPSVFVTYSSSCCPVSLRQKCQNHCGVVSTHCPHLLASPNSLFHLSVPCSMRTTPLRFSVTAMTINPLGRFQSSPHFIFRESCPPSSFKCPLQQAPRAPCPSCPLAPLRSCWLSHASHTPFK